MPSSDPVFLFDEGDLPPGQFRIVPEQDMAFASQGNDVRVLPIGSYCLVHHALLPVTAIDGASGKTVGAMLGTMLDTETGAPVATSLVTKIVDTDQHEEMLRALYERVFGSWILLIEIEGRLRMYLDPAGTLSAVYEPELGIAGSTASAVLSRDAYRDRFDIDLYRRLDVAREGWFPAGLTAHQGLRRLMCNHYLDIATSRAVRHWPPTAPERITDGSSLIDEIALATRRNIRIMMDRYKCAMALTGGYDTRTLLSLYDPRPGEQLDTYIINVEGGPDPYIARKLAGMCAVSHSELKPDRSAPADEAVWHSRVGHAIGGGNAAIYTTLRRLRPVEALLEGFGGEVARAFFWRPNDDSSSEVTARAICIRFGMALQPEVLAAVEDWLADAPPGDGLFLLDLAYLELRVSCWLYAQSYVDQPLLHISPMISRPIFDSMFRLPPDLKRLNSTPRAIVSRNRPDFMAYKFSRFGDIRDAFETARKALKPHLARKKLRKLFAR